MNSTVTLGGRLRRVATAIAASAVLGATLVACSSGGGSTGGGSASDIDAALKKGGTITYWSWTPSAEAQVAAFEKEYPKVNVKLVNAGTNTTEYTKLQNAIKAGSGAPDVAQVEYYAIPQFALGDALVDLKPYGFDSLKDDYTHRPVELGQRRRQALRPPAGLRPHGAVLQQDASSTSTASPCRPPGTSTSPPRKKLHAADPTKYITSDTGDSGFTTSMIWQAGGRPFTADGTNVTINLQDEGTKKWTATWNQLVEGKLLSTIPGWSDEWYKGLGNGTIATLVTGAWMPGVLESSVKDALRRLARRPDADLRRHPGERRERRRRPGRAQAEQEPGARGRLPEVAEQRPGAIKVFLASGGFPSTTADLNSQRLPRQAPEYFGGQKINEVLVDGAKDVSTGWQYLPFQVYANSIFGDTVGQAYASNGDLNAGLEAWQKSLVDYGNQQGFTVTGK